MSAPSLINIGELAKPATVLIEKISDAVGVIYDPTRIRREAKAKADAALTEAGALIEIGDMERRAMSRFVHEQSREQKNIEDITTKALPRLDRDADPSRIDEDWLAEFFARSRRVSNDQMQDLWARILSGEANRPESVSKRTLEFVSLMDRLDAATFARLCSFSDNSLGEVLIFDIDDPILRDTRLTYEDLAHLDSIGLIQLSEGFGSFSHADVDEKLTISVSGRTLNFEARKPAKDEELRHLPLGRVIFTKTGRELRRFVAIDKVEEYYQYCVVGWNKLGCNLHSPTNQPRR